MTTHNLPTQSTPFVGRAEELAEISLLLVDPACRLLTLLGSGGIGKTRLAIQAASQMTHEFPHGVYFVSLASLSTPENIVRALAGVLGLYVDTGAPPKQQLLDHLSRKNLLFVMDNFEHLLDGAELVAELLAGAPEVKVLTTSREVLNLQEEWVRRIDGLRFPASDRVEHIEDYSAVRLFVERARRIRADFSLMAERVEVVRICQLVVGMPLGVELAAGWLKTMNCAQVAAEIQQNLDFLASPLRNIPERHRSMRAVFDSSWKLLTPQEQQIFRALAVFRGGFAREAADRVAGASFATLSALVDKSLLQWTPAGRYDLHELLRQYAEQQLEAAGEGAGVRAAHSAYYLDFLAQRDADVKGRRQQPALHEIRADFENIRASWRWAVEQHDDHVIHLAINCLVNFAEMDNGLTDVFAMVDSAAAAFAPAADAAADPVWEQVVVRREWLKHRLLTPPDSALVEAILGRTRARGDDEETAWCLWVLADHASLGDDPACLVALAEESLALRRALGDAFYIAHALMGLHAAYFQNRQLERSTECVQESAAIRRKLGDIQSLCVSLSWLGAKSLYAGYFSEAERSFDQAITLQEEIGKALGYVTPKALKAALAFWRGEFGQAAQLVQAGLDFAQDQNPFGSKSLSLAVLSFGVSLGGDYARGRALCEQAAASYRGDISIWIHWGLALATCASGDDQAAHQALHATLLYAEERLKSITFQQLCLPLAVILSARADQPEQAVELLGLAYTAAPMLTGWMEKWPLLNELQYQLEVQLGEETFTAAWKRGQAISLEVVVKALSGSFQPVADQSQRTSSEAANRSLREPLSARELEVLRLVTAGLSNAEIASKLFIAVATVKVHTGRIYGKLGVTSRTQAVAQAHKLHLLSAF